MPCSASATTTLCTCTFLVPTSAGVTATGIPVNHTALPTRRSSDLAANGGSNSLAAGASVTFTATHSENATTNNTVTVSGTEAGATVSNTATASVKIGSAHV